MKTNQIKNVSVEKAMDVLLWVVVSVGGVWLFMSAFNELAR
jgi:hypothetical protein